MTFGATVGTVILVIVVGAIVLGVLGAILKAISDAWSH